MISRLRVKLARWLVGNDPARLMVVHGYGIAKFMTFMGASKVSFITGDGKFYTVTRGDQEDDTLSLQCEVCTNVFKADLDRPAKCPSCGSSHVNLAEQD